MRAYTLFLKCAFLPAVLCAQTAGTGTKPSKVQPPTPVIRCTEKDTDQACRSLKELVEARDKGVLFGIVGDPADTGRHFAYVCLRPGRDSFTITDFTVPAREGFKPFRSWSPRSQDESLRSLDQQTRKLVANAFFLRSEHDHPLSDVAIDAWYADHHKDLLYAHGPVGVAVYQNGLLADLKVETGEWRRSATNASNAHDTGYAEFVGPNYWIQSYNQIHSAAEYDDPSALHFTADGRIVYARYTYQNKQNDYVKYTLQIHRSTGRFVETFETAGVQDEERGTCRVFKY